MKLEDFRELEKHEVAVVLDHGTDKVAAAYYNSIGGECDCCKDWSVAEAEVILVRNAVTGEVVWSREVDSK